MNATELVTRANTLPELPVVIARDMITAQGYTPTVAERAAIVARADFFGSMGLSRGVTVKVNDFHGAHIGNLEFHI